jgi:L-serine deaminase
MTIKGNKIGSNQIDLIGSSIGGAMAGLTVVVLGMFVALDTSSTAILIVSLTTIFNYYIPPISKQK